MTISSLFHNRSTLALVTSQQQQPPPPTSNQTTNNNNNNLRPSSSSNDSNQQTNNPYRNHHNSRFTLSFNNLINRTRTNRQPTTPPPPPIINTQLNHSLSSPITNQSPIEHLMHFSLGPSSSPPNSSINLNQSQPTTSSSSQLPPIRTSSVAVLLPNQSKSILRRIQSRKKENSNNLLSTILSPSSSSTTQDSSEPPLPPIPSTTTNPNNTQQQQQPQPIRSTSQPPPIPRSIRSTTERLRTHHHHSPSNQSNTHQPDSPPTNHQEPIIRTTPNDNNMPHQTFSLRLVPHLDATRSLHFEPIERKLNPSSSLKLGRFTDRGTPQANTDTRIAFKSKVVSRGHADIFTDQVGSFFIKDTKSSSGTFLNHIRLSPPGNESRAFPLRDGDVLQLGVDYQGGTEEIYRCVKMRVELNRGWQRSANVFNQQALAQLRTLGAKGTTSPPTTITKDLTSLKNTHSATSELPKPVSDCCICLFGVTVCQALFIAPCSHTYHYKCIRPLLQMHHPGFSCPLCRTFADLEADVETDDSAPSPGLPPVEHHSPPGPSTDSPPPSGRSDQIDHTVIHSSTASPAIIDRAHTMVMSPEMAASYRGHLADPDRASSGPPLSASVASSVDHLSFNRPDDHHHPNRSPQHPTDGLLLDPDQFILRFPPAHPSTSPDSTQIRSLTTSAHPTTTTTTTTATTATTTVNKPAKADSLPAPAFGPHSPCLSSSPPSLLHNTTATIPATSPLPVEDPPSPLLHSNHLNPLDPSALTSNSSFCFPPPPSSRLATTNSTPPVQSSPSGVDNRAAAGRPL